MVLVLNHSNARVSLRKRTCSKLYFFMTNVFTESIRQCSIDATLKYFDGTLTQFKLVQ